jgi:hypothetical protein
MSDWQNMDSAPKTGEAILVLTSDFGIVTAYWDASVQNFYKSQEGWASYDPDNAQGDWISEWSLNGETDRRLYCGATPCYWKPIGDLPMPDHGFSEWFSPLLTGNKQRVIV